MGISRQAWYRRRRRAGRPSKDEPWIEAGVSRATWFRRQKLAKESANGHGKLKGSVGRPGTTEGKRMLTEADRLKLKEATRLRKEALTESLRLQRPAGRPLVEEEEETFEATRPWEALGISKRTWYRRRKEAKLKEQADVQG
jgi:hypothetical protein